MRTNFEMIKEFHATYNQELNESLNMDAVTQFRKLRYRLIEEEFEEVMDEMFAETVDPVKLAKELTDLLYVVYGTGATFGIDLDKCFAEVHASNMSKLGKDGKPIYREDGKVLKGPYYRQADLNKIVK